LYATEQKTGQIFTMFAIVAISIASLGLFGLVAFTTAQRRKEIGIRKVLGASEMRLLFLLSKEFLQLICISFIISIPIAGLAMHYWLANFAYRINISWVVFAMAGLSALVIALVTVSFQTIKAARADPVKSLRTE
jgi:putative ABC transport system permease protein